MAPDNLRIGLENKTGLLEMTPTTRLFCFLFLRKRQLKLMPRKMQIR